VILEQGDQVGMSWRHHYHRLHLHTDKGHSELPLLGFDPALPRYLSRLQFIDYLESYAAHFRLPVRFAERLLAARRVDGLWQAHTTAGSWRAPHLIMATGYNRLARAVEWPAMAAFAGELLHSSAYRDGRSYRDRRVLVVGLGNSGGEIAIDLHEHGARVALSVRGPVNVIPREVLGIPILTLSILQSRLPARLADWLNAPIQRLLIGDLARFGLRKPAHGPVQQIRDSARIPLIDIGTVELIKRGEIQVFPAIETFFEGGVRFVDGRRLACDAVILATGYSPGVAELLPEVAGAVDARGVPVSDTAPENGLHFCGFRLTATGMLRDISIEARRIARAVAR
jgi:indole-3-pyruvate monooxygenase